MKFPFVGDVKSETETEKIAQEFARLLKPGDVIGLTGELGSGKTFFVKAACKTFGIMNVSSPSFAIVNFYNGIEKINHFDFYRIKKIEELYDIGFDEYIDEHSITFIEWAEMFPELMPAKYYQIKIVFSNNDNRKITISKNE